MILLTVHIIIKGPVLPDLDIKIDESINADTIVLQMLSQRLTYIIKSVNEVHEKSGC